MIDKEYKKILKQYHKVSDRHKIRINAKFMLINLTKCKKPIMSHGIIAEDL